MVLLPTICQTSLQTFSSLPKNQSPWITFNCLIANEITHIYRVSFHLAFYGFCIRFFPTFCCSFKSPAMMLHRKFSATLCSETLNYECNRKINLINPCVSATQTGWQKLFKPPKNKCRLWLYQREKERERVSVCYEYVTPW